MWKRLVHVLGVYGEYIIIRIVLSLRQRTLTMNKNDVSNGDEYFGVTTSTGHELIVMWQLFTKSWWRRNMGIPVWYVDEIGTRYSTRFIMSERDGPMIRVKAFLWTWRWVPCNCDGTFPDNLMLYVNGKPSTWRFKNRKLYDE